jgi:hypothetical protein
MTGRAKEMIERLERRSRGSHGVDEFAMDRIDATLLLAAYRLAVADVDLWHTRCGSPPFAEIDARRQAALDAFEKEACK